MERDNRKRMRGSRVSMIKKRWGQKEIRTKMWKEKVEWQHKEKGPGSWFCPCFPIAGNFEKQKKLQKTVLTCLKSLG